MPAMEVFFIARRNQRKGKDPTASTPAQRGHVHDKGRIPFAAADPDNDYIQNIQVADLNATLAVIMWKKLMGFYIDFDREHFSVYEVDGNSIINEDGS